MPRMGQPNLAVVSDDMPPELETLTCIAGHEWQRKRVNGGMPQSCPRHQRFMDETLARRLQPPDLVVDSWVIAGENLGQPDYVKRWRKKWEKVVRRVGAMQNSWRGVDLELVDVYVRHLRLAELHRLYAEMTPYITSKDTGMVRQHPGWERSHIEERLAREAAVDLGFVEAHSAPPQQGGSDDGDQEPGDGGGFVDDQLGPDGKPL